MKRHGNTVHSEGPYRIVELIEIYQDGSRVLLGYNIVGPDSPGHLYTLEEALLRLDELLENGESSSPSP